MILTLTGAPRDLLALSYTFLLLAMKVATQRATRSTKPRTSIRFNADTKREAAESPGTGTAAAVHALYTRKSAYARSISEVLRLLMTGPGIKGAF